VAKREVARGEAAAREVAQGEVARAAAVRAQAACASSVGADDPWADVPTGPEPEDPWAGAPARPSDAVDPWVDAASEPTAERTGGGRPAGARRSSGSSWSGRGARGGRRGRGSAQEPPENGAAAVDAEPDHEQVARTVALRLLTGAPRSRAQLAEAMARRDVPDEIADRVLDRFTEVGLVDDAAYAEVLVRSRHAEKGLSRRALAMELRRRGVDPVTAAEALEQVEDSDEESAARVLVRRKLASTRGLDREVRVRRTSAMLGRKGYGGGLVSRLVREELAAEGQADADPWADEPLG
jgi:regulatory protein